MAYISYIIVALIPALAVIIIVYVFLKKNGEKEIKHLSLQVRGERQKFFLEPRMDAYQRMVLFLERVSPYSMVMRLHEKETNATIFQEKLLNSVREEFNHNVAQQLFIPIPTWEIIKKSKEETIKIINTSGKEMGSNATSLELSNKIFEICGQIEELPTEIAIKALKSDFQKLF